MTKQFVTNVIGKKYFSWVKGDIILITAGTGTGKSTFVKNELSTYCKHEGKYILYLTNRNILKAQIIKDIGNSDNILVMNYQEIEILILNNTLCLDYFDYVVCDEGHYFFSDSGFNGKTDLFFDTLMNNKSIIKILMTATPRLLSWYFNNNDCHINYTYNLKTNYDYINKIVAFNNYDSIDSIIADIPNDEQIILFSTAQRAYETAKKFKGSFICSEFNSQYNKYIATDELNNIINHGCFNNHLLCTTTVLDNGININEGIPVKHIIIDIFDRDEFIQCLGRKRIGENETVSLYFYDWSDKKRLNGFRRKIVNSINNAEFLKKHGEIEYTNRNYKTNLYDSRVVDDIVGIDGQIHKVVNKCMLTKLQADNKMYESILSKEKKYEIVTYKHVISIALNINEDKFILLETEEKADDLITYLDSIVGDIMLQVKDRQELIDMIDVKSNSKQLKRLNNLNGALEEREIPFRIVEFTTSKIIDGNKKNFKNAWRVEKLCI